MNTPQILGSKGVTGVAASGVLAGASGVVCDGSLFQEIAVSTKLLTSDGVRAKTSVSLCSCRTTTRGVRLAGQCC